MQTSRGWDNGDEMGPMPSERRAASTENWAQKTVVFDGDCGVCMKVISFLQLRHGSGRLDFIPYQSADLDRLAPGISRDMASRALYVLFPSGSRHAGARGVFSVMRELSGLWGPIGTVGSLPLLYLVAEPFYRLFAANRRRVSRWLGLDGCPVPKRIGGPVD